MNNKSQGSQKKSRRKKFINATIIVLGAIAGMATIAMLILNVFFGADISFSNMIHQLFHKNERNIALLSVRLIAVPGSFSPKEAHDDFLDNFKIDIRVKNLETSNVIISAIAIPLKNIKNAHYKGREVLHLNTTGSNPKENKKFVILKPGEEKDISYDSFIQFNGITDFLSQKSLNNETMFYSRDGSVLYNLNWVKRLERFMKSTYGDKACLDICLYESSDVKIFDKNIPITSADPNWGGTGDENSLINYSTLIADAHFQLLEDRKIDYLHPIDPYTNKGH